MNAVRQLQSVPAVLSPEASSFLGPAVVLAVDGSVVDVDLGPREPVQRVCARLATAFPYRPCEGDVLLVIGKDGAHWVIGVIEGKGETNLSFEGAVALHAKGELKLKSDGVVRIEGPRVEVQADKLSTFAGAVVERFSSLVQRVHGALNVRAQKAHTIVDESSLLTAKNASILTEETMNINGRQIHLG